MIIHNLIDYSNQLQQQGLYRKRVLLDSDSLSFCSSDYLSLTDEPSIKKAYQKGFEYYSSGSRGSMVVCGYHAAHQQLEQAFAAALNVDEVLLFTSGYAANLAVSSLLARVAGTVLIDKAVHASFYDGLSIYRAKTRRYLHLDLEQLAVKLQAATGDSVVVTESVFSMSGQIALLAKMRAICAKHQAHLIVDEAHAFGVLGPQGMGLIAEHGLTQDEIPLRIIPFGKAMGSQGAVVAGKAEWMDVLLQVARSAIYSTAISPALAYGLSETLLFVQQAEERRHKLKELIDYFRKIIERSPLQWEASITPIQQLQLGCPHLALSCAEFLKKQGIFCQPMRSPTVSKKNTGLRVILNYHHEFEDVDRLFVHLHDFYEFSR